ncbi:metallophosphoesterase [Ornithinicoccus halotolerans]|uniref:metallophosphoesterase n=1 Tax=Ornithinicoccus halotolerans TaxID=1748220 RepID=UPI00129770F7|nr:metallophosphoesterase [Ornithinicoccus halotolerans]
MPRGRNVLLTTGVLALPLAWATVVEPRWFALRQLRAPVLPAGSRPLRVLHLSDLHLVPRQRHKVEWVRRLAELQPDLVVTTGDNLAHPQAVPAVLDAYRPLLDRPGVFVLGSNDYFAPRAKNPLRYLTDSHPRGEDLGTRPLPTGDLVRALEQAGWHDLDNRRTRVTAAGLDLELVGVDDPHLGYDRYDEVAAPAAPDADLTVGVTHAPYQRVLDAMTADGAQLLLAGHTHGGQLRVPGWGALVTNCDLDTGRARGLSRWWPGAGSTPSSEAPPGAAWLEVSAGLGGSPYAPFRFACRPEATLLTLTP